jgi:biotin carboxylase
MNVIFLSPHFPPNYHLFCLHLRRLGHNVLGIGDASYDQLPPRVREVLSDYYRVDTLDDRTTVLRAATHLAGRYGSIDRVASHNEHWLELEGEIRETLGVPGRNIAETARVRRKSLMKSGFAAAGVDVATGRIVRSLDEARNLIRETGFPVIVKPDRGVGASATYKLDDDGELVRFFERKPAVEYFMEAFVEGNIVTFDGLADAEGGVVFHMSLVYSRNIMEVVAEDDHVFYYTLRELPADLISAGTASVAAFGLREQFFHFEFFRTPAGRLLGLEINARPPGWPTTDMFDYANDADVYREWANVVSGRRGEYEWNRKYHCIYVGRKDRIRYRNRHEEIVGRYARFVVDVIRLPDIFSRAMGNQAYIARSAELADLLELAEYVQASTPA